MAREDAAARVNDLLAPYLEGRDLEIYRTEYRKEGREWVLRVFLDKPIGSENEYVSIEECEDVTRYLSDALDKEDFIDRSYNLEVSSPGLDRELIKDSDYERFKGHAVEIKTYEQINGSKEHTGCLLGREDGVVKIEENGDTTAIPSEKISKINLAVVF